MKPSAIVARATALALTLSSASAATFVIPDGDVAALKSAIIAANSNGQNDVIKLAANGTYSLIDVDNIVGSDSRNANGLPVIGADGGKALTLQGNGARLERNNAGPSFRLLYVGDGAQLAIVRLTMTGGDVSNTEFDGMQGGAIFNSVAALRLEDCVLRVNAAGLGGAIYSRGTLDLVRSVVSDNLVFYSLGCEETCSSLGYGGGIYSDGSLTISESTISRNNTPQDSGEAGGIWSAGPLTVANSTFNANAAAGGGGAIRVADYNGAFQTVVMNCTFNLNRAVTGGAIYHSGSLLTVLNSTFNRNSAPLEGGAISNNADLLASMLDIGSTILRSGKEGPNIFNRDGGTVHSRGYNLSNDAAGGDATTNPGGFLNATGDQRNTDPLLDPNNLQNNGGLTRTVSLQPGSPAIDKGKDFSGTGRDQRGALRPVAQPGLTPAPGGDSSDIGAFEEPPISDAAFVSQNVPATMVPGGVYHVSVTMRNTGGSTWTFADRYKLSSINPTDNVTWGLKRVRLPVSLAVPPGATWTFAFDVTAPSVPGEYSFQWRMLQELVTRFGQKSPDMQVDVH